MKKFNLKKYKLSNNLTLLIYPISWTDSVSIYVAVGAGPKYETGETAGLAHFLEHMLFEGTKKFPSSKELAVYLEAVGGKSGAWTDKEHTVYYVKTPVKHIKTAISYLYELFFNSLLDIQSINKEKQIVLEEINRKNDNPEDNIWDLFMEWVWGKHQWAGLSTLGDAVSINKITGQKIKSYMDTLYVPNNMVLTVVGVISPAKIKKYISMKFSKIKINSTIPKIDKMVFNQKTSPVKVISSSSNQNQFILGFITGVSLLNKDRYPLMLLSSILSKGVSSRLFNKLVYECGYAYSFWLHNWFFSDTGILCATGGVSTKNIIKSLDVITTEFEKLKNEEIGIKELNHTKTLEKTDFSYLLENPGQIANYYATKYLLEGKTTTLKEFSINIDKITPSDIQRVSKKYLIYENLCFLIKGPVNEKLKKPIEELFIKKFKT